MEAGSTPGRHARAQHRHELRTLTYVTLDQANAGVVRNLTNRGIGVQVVTAVRPKQQLRVRFDLRYPRLPIETRAEVVWATFSGQCGIRFLEMPPVLAQQINEWIFGNLLEGISLHIEHSESIFAASRTRVSEVSETPTSKPESAEPQADDGLMVSETPVKVIALPIPWDLPEPEVLEEVAVPVPEPDSTALDWLTQPLTGRTLAWTVDGLVVVAALLLFVLVFLSVTREAPKWPLAMVAGASLTMAAMYWGFFRVMAGASLGVKLARIAEMDSETDPSETRFR